MLWWADLDLAWTIKIKRLYLEKVLVITHTSILMWVCLISASSDLWSLSVLVYKSKGTSPHRDFAAHAVMWTSWSGKCSAAPLNWTAWGSPVLSMVFLGLDLPRSRMCLLNCRHHTWTCIPVLKQPDSQYSLLEYPSTETCLIPTGTIKITSCKPWILATGISSPFSGLRSGLTD